MRTMDLALSFVIPLFMAIVLIFSGTQLNMLGLLGEYPGCLFLTVNQRPQAVVREVVRDRNQALP